MPSIRIATFNVENLFARWQFGAEVDPATANTEGWHVDQTRFHPLSMNEKALTGAAVRELKADVIAFQEVESVDTLKHFRARSLDGSSAYPYVAGIDGNDPRLIDVAVLSKLPITHVRSYQHLRDPEQRTTPLFSRDCLEVDVDVGGERPLTVFANHLKSMMGGREETKPKRERQAAAVREIVTGRFGPNPGEHPFVVLGDLNDYMATDDQGSPGIGSLVEWEEVENVVTRRAADDQWTHFYKSRKSYTQLDYLLLSNRLAEANPQPPEIMRKGMPGRAERYTGERFFGVGWDEPKASDHCAVVIDLDLGT